ncbi:MAG: hypothetical protein MUE65_06375 [Methanomassiliicoccales archaeon]|jgi:hypothetical protein|nr:hypothetical protein [Methanomassiliicoccales archaeon]
MGGRRADGKGVEKDLEGALARIEALEREMRYVIKLNALNEFLLRYGRKAYFLFGPFDQESALSKLDRDSNWPWREVNRRCNYCGCFLFPAKEMDRDPPMNTMGVDFEHTVRDHILEKSAQAAEFDPEVRDAMLREPERYLHYYYARGRKVPFGDYTVLYFHAPCFESILDGEGPWTGRGPFLGND